MNLYAQNATGSVHKELQTARSVTALPEKSLQASVQILCLPLRLQE